MIDEHLVRVFALFRLAEIVVFLYLLALFFCVATVAVGFSPEIFNNLHSVEEKKEVEEC